jgi:hypothetical protein
MSKTLEQEQAEFKELLIERGLLRPDKPKVEPPKPIRLAASNPHVPLRVQEERIKEKVDQYKADHDRELRALREREEKLEQEWRKQRARGRLTAELQYKLDLARYVQLELGGSLVKHVYDPFSRERMRGED